MAGRAAHFKVIVISVLLITLFSSSAVSQAHASSKSTSFQRSADGPSRARFERWATITKTQNGYYYDAGQQNTSLVISRGSVGVRLADTHTDFVRSLPQACKKQRANRGIVVICRVPASVSAKHPLTVKVFTRLGNDFVDATALPPSIELYGLADRGRDVFKGGKGDDYIQGAQNNDRVI